MISTGANDRKAGDGETTSRNGVGRDGAIVLSWDYLQATT